MTSLFSGYVSALLAEHASNPSQNWKAKDCAMYLVVALAVRGRTAAAGVTSTNQLVNIQDFFNQQVGSCSPARRRYLLFKSRASGLLQGSGKEAKLLAGSAVGPVHSPPPCAAHAGALSLQRECSLAHRGRAHPTGASSTPAPCSCTRLISPGKTMWCPCRSCLS